MRRAVSPIHRRVVGHTYQDVRERGDERVITSKVAGVAEYADRLTGDVAVAWAIAEGALSEPLPRRWAHSKGVWRQAITITSGLDDADADVLAQAAILHDVGYAPALATTEFHPIDGAHYLRSIGLPEQVVNLVAHHSCARIEAEFLGLGATLGAFAPGAPELADRLIYADMTTSPDGTPITVSERLAEILKRYGPHGQKARFVRSAEGELRAATARVTNHLSPRGTRRTVES